MSRNPIARHLRQHRHQVVIDKRTMSTDRQAAREVSELMAESIEAMTDIPWNPTKSDGTNYD